MGHPVRPCVFNFEHFRHPSATSITCMHTRHPSISGRLTQNAVVSMASSDKTPQGVPTSESHTPGTPMKAGQYVLDKGAQMLQSLKPVKQMKQHVCTFALYSHDMTRPDRDSPLHHSSQPGLPPLKPPTWSWQIGCAGIEYIVSDRIFEALPPEEQKLWHSHAYEIKSGMWVNPGVPEMIQKPELENIAKSYGKFWCTWQVDRGDRLPLGAPALMMSPQAVNLGIVRPDLPEWINPNADYWKQSFGKGFALDIEPTEMKLRAPFP
ncbi:Oil body-associated protein 2B [Vitis vinifera]|uniref:Oil body-associated protein 2B n=1 Tax=Vitis vinifera TaxID=29760 RepID=A0A438H432_VITVI|nr:Oil body-associated protein 2B [Vitis vinifera]